MKNGEEGLYEAKEASSKFAKISEICEGRLASSEEELRRRRDWGCRGKKGTRLKGVKGREKEHSKLSLLASNPEPTPRPGASYDRTTQKIWKGEKRPAKKYPYKVKVNRKKKVPRGWEMKESLRGLERFLPTRDKRIEKAGTWEQEITRANYKRGSSGEERIASQPEKTKKHFRRSLPSCKLRPTTPRDSNWGKRRRTMV